MPLRSPSSWVSGQTKGRWYPLGGRFKVLPACVIPTGPHCPHPLPCCPLDPGWGLVEVSVEDAKIVLFNQLHPQTHVALPCGHLSVTIKHRPTQNFLRAHQRKKPQCHQDLGAWNQQHLVLRVWTKPPLPQPHPPVLGVSCMGRLGLGLLKGFCSQITKCEGLLGREGSSLEPPLCIAHRTELLSLSTRKW